jgi:Rrf2 family iron-sulfur cluster assembly transcriptional regulator
MELTKACSYGVFGMIYLAKQPQGKIVSLAEISRAENLPEKFLAKIFQNLTRSGLIRSHRGAGGGFSLARPANKITVKELLESIEGHICFAKCLSEMEDCDKKDICKLRKHLKKIQDYAIKIMIQNTLADLVK